MKTAWEAAVLPLNYTRSARQQIDWSIKLPLRGFAFGLLDSTEAKQTELSGTESPVKIPECVLRSFHRSAPCSRAV